MPSARAARARYSGKPAGGPAQSSAFSRLILRQVSVRCIAAARASSTTPAGRYSARQRIRVPSCAASAVSTSWRRYPGPAGRLLSQCGVLSGPSGFLEGGMGVNGGRGFPLPWAAPHAQYQPGRAGRGAGEGAAGHAAT